MRPESAKAPGVTSAEGLQETKPTSAVSVAADDDSGNAQTDPIREKLALAGFTSHGLDSGGFIVCRWGLSKHCPGTRELRHFAAAVGALP